MTCLCTHTEDEHDPDALDGVPFFGVCMICPCLKFEEERDGDDKEEAVGVYIALYGRH